MAMRIDGMWMALVGSWHGDAGHIDGTDLQLLSCQALLAQANRSACNMQHNASFASTASACGASQCHSNRRLPKATILRVTYQSDCSSSPLLQMVQRSPVTSCGCACSGKHIEKGSPWCDTETTNCTTLQACRTVAQTCAFPNAMHLCMVLGAVK